MVMSDEIADSLSIQLKGTGFGIRLIFPIELSDERLLKEFEAIPQERYLLPIGTGVVLDFQSRACSEDLISQILFKVIWPKGINVLAWLTSDETSAAQLSRAGFKTVEPCVQDFSQDFPSKATNSDTLILEHSLRSGQHEEFPGNVILIGHLNSGAEIFAERSIFVLGRLKGLAHAGRSGTEGVYIVAGSFEPQQLRIGDKFCAQFGSGMKWWKKPVIITLEEEGLLFRDWKLEAGNEAT